MIIWLDHKIFGNGYGLSAPFWDQRYYWLTQNRKHGELYTFSYGFGAQLQSFQWTHPKPGERRILGGYEFRVYQSRRSWFRVSVSWGYVSMPEDIGKARALLDKMKEKLGRNE